MTTASLDRLLAAVSRSIFLTLKVAPRRVRRQLGTAYLFCRAADTIADTRLLPAAERLEHLSAFRAQFHRDEPKSEDLERIARRIGGPSPLPEERQLLERLGECFALHGAFAAPDRALICRLVTTLTRGMEMDLERFPAEGDGEKPAGGSAAPGGGLNGEVVALRDDEELDRYCYHVAGCVGEFWTDLQLLHLPALRHWNPEAMREKGVRFGKGLQMTNVLRDVDRDLTLGRCYLPLERLEALGRSAQEVRNAEERRFLRPLIDDLLRVTLEHYRAGWEYTLAVPRRLVSLRLACTWPLLIGLRTLALLAAAADPCAPGVVRKIPRAEVRTLRRASVVRVISNRAMDRLYRGLEEAVVGNLDSTLAR